jgi:hypothetical protein
VTGVTFVTGLIWIPLAPGGVYMDFMWTSFKNTVRAEYLWYVLGLRSKPLTLNPKFSPFFIELGK